MPKQSLVQQLEDGTMALHWQIRWRPLVNVGPVVKNHGVHHLVRHCVHEQLQARGACGALAAHGLHFAHVLAPLAPQQVNVVVLCKVGQPAGAAAAAAQVTVKC